MMTVCYVGEGGKAEIMALAMVHCTRGKERSIAETGEATKST